MEGKIRTREELKKEIDALRRAGKKIVFPNGCRQKMPELKNI